MKYPIGSTLVVRSEGSPLKNAIIVAGLASGSEIQYLIVSDFGDPSRMDEVDMVGLYSVDLSTSCCVEEVILRLALVRDKLTIAIEQVELVRDIMSIGEK